MLFKKDKKDKKDIVVLDYSSKELESMADQKIFSGEYLEALTILESIKRKSGESDDNLIKRINILTDIGDFDDALMGISRYMAKHGEQTDRSLFLLGQLYLAIGDYEAATQIFSNIKADKSSELTDDELHDLADSLEQCTYAMETIIKDYKAEIGEIEPGDDSHIIDVEQLDYDNMIKEAERLYDEENYAEMIEMLETYALEHPEDEQPSYLLLMAYYVGHETDRGIKFLNKVRNKLSKNARTRCVTAMIYAAAGLKGDAMSECEIVLKADCPDSETAAKIYAMLCQVGGMEEEEFKYAKLCYSLNQYSKNNVHIYARSLALHGERESAIMMYNNILKLSPDDVEAKHYINMLKTKEVIDKNDIQMSYALPVQIFVDNLAQIFASLRKGARMPAENIPFIKQALVFFAKANAIDWFQKYLPECVKSYKNKISDVYYFIIKNPMISDEIKEITISAFPNLSKSSLVYHDGLLLPTGFDANKNEADEDEKISPEEERLHKMLAERYRDICKDTLEKSMYENGSFILIAFVAGSPKFDESHIDALVAVLIYCAYIVADKRPDPYKLADGYGVTPEQMDEAMELMRNSSKAISKILNLGNKKRKK